MTNLPQPIPGVAVITGYNSGLGAAICDHLVAGLGWKVYGIADTGSDFDDGSLLTQIVCDIQWPSEIDELPDRVGQPIDVLINCAGVNHLCSFPDLAGRDWERVMDTNAKAIYMMSQTFLPLLSKAADRDEGGTILNIVSNAAHVPMTHSLVYNASKAAALMMTKQMARELFKSHGIHVFSISPNKLRGTRMSREIEEAVPALRGWTPEEAATYQRASLPIGEETEPDTLAEFITFLLSTKERHRYLHGCDIPYGG